MTEYSNTPERRFPWPLIAVVLLFLVPLIAAVIWYQQTTQSSSSSMANDTVQYGALVQPPLPVSLPAVGATEKNHWRMVQFWDASDADAAMALHLKTREAHGALAKKLDRVRRLVLTTELPNEPLSNDVAIDIALLTPAEYSEYALQFLLSDTPVEQQIFLIDPLGNWLMIYEKDFDRDGLLSDLKRLLKYSRIG